MTATITIKIHKATRQKLKLLAVHSEETMMDLIDRLATQEQEITMNQQQFINKDDAKGPYPDIIEGQSVYGWHGEYWIGHVTFSGDGHRLRLIPVSELQREYLDKNYSFIKQEAQTMKYNYTTGTKGSVISLETGRYADTVEGDTSEKMDAHTALAQMLDEVERPGWTATDETLSDFTPQQLREYVGAE